MPDRAITSAVLVASVLACLPAAAVAGVPGSSGGMGSADTTVEPDFAWRKRVPAGQTVAIRGIRGNVRVELASGGETEITAVKRGSRGDGVSVIARENDGGVAVCALYPSNRSDGMSASHCGVDEHVVNARSSNTQVDFHVKLPAGVRLDVRTVEGEVRVSDLRSDVRVSTVGGAVTMQGMRARRVEATTVSGRVDFIGEFLGDGDYRFTSTSGAVSIGINPDADARLTVISRFGRVRSDFPWQRSVPLEAGGGAVEPALQARLGSGGAHLVVRTLSGAVTLREAVRP